MSTGLPVEARQERLQPFSGRFCCIISVPSLQQRSEFIGDSPRDLQCYSCLCTCLFAAPNALIFNGAGVRCHISAQARSLGYSCQLPTRFQPVKPPKTRSSRRPEHEDNSLSRPPPSRWRSSLLLGSAVSFGLGRRASPSPQPEWCSILGSRFPEKLRMGPQGHRILRRCVCRDASVLQASPASICTACPSVRKKLAFESFPGISVRLIESQGLR